MDAGQYTKWGDEQFARGRLDEALAAYRQALAQVPSFPPARMGLDAVLEQAHSDRPNEQLIALLLEAYADPGANWFAIGWPAALQLNVGWPASPTPEAMAGNRLLIEFLRKSLNRHAALERKLVALRDATARVLQQPAPPQEAAVLASAFAEQAWHNEYIWPDDPTVPDGPAGAMYRPPPEPRPETVEERRLAEGFPEIAPITDAVSQSVAAMYEANPYPRWTHLPHRLKHDVRAALLRNLPHARQIAFDDLLSRPLSVLMPGAGTGQHPLSVASWYDNVQVTAVDLSRASLAYGKRMAGRLGIDNIEFVRGDILDLAKLGRTFDHAECVGVLHHMADPKAGLLAISQVLRPGAFLRIGLYGESARRLVVQARQEIAAAKLPATLEGLRDFRHRVLNGKWRKLAKLADWEDFWSASLLRDLCFHVQEHRFTVQRLRAFLEGSGLTFLGFEFPPTAGVSPLQHYRARFPMERTFANLDNWEQLEREKSNLFPGFPFICQKD
ncbi:MAG TPA: methyltransferase domain-containing protein [Reyranella sp.]|nr:methyltransferase domain-containing protein [Reyranella sp.]